MGFLDTLRNLMSPIEVEERHESTLERAQLRGFPGRYPGSPVSSREAMSVPAVYRAVSLISNTVGQLSMEAFRRGTKLDFEETPRVVVRPDPFTTPQVAWRDTAYHMARRGEVWWWIAARDSDGGALSVIPVDPREVVVDENPRRPERPVIRWRDQVMRNEDFRQITILRDPSNPLRGFGPLQACGAAVTVAVEAQDFALDFFRGGGIPSTLIKAGMQLTDDEAQELKNQWMAGGGNVPRVIDPRIDSVEFPGTDLEKAEASESQMFSVGQVARMFGIPGALMEFSTPGSSLTYTNLETVWIQFQSSCLTPNYLEPIEQTMTDILTRSMTARFSLAGLLRADQATRFATYAAGVPLGIVTVEEARAAEGFESGDIENRPIPPAPPQAIPTPSQFPVEVRSAPLRDLRCPSCSHLLGRNIATGGEIKCRCGTLAVA